MLSELKKFLTKHDLHDITNSRSIGSNILHVHPNDSLSDCLKKFKESNFSFLLICTSDHSSKNLYCYASHPSNSLSVQWISLVEVLKFLFTKENHQSSFSYTVNDCRPHWSSTILKESTTLKDLIDLYLSDPFFKNESSINIFPVLVIDGEVKSDKSLYDRNNNSHTSNSNSNNRMSSIINETYYNTKDDPYHIDNHFHRHTTKPILIKNDKLLRVIGVITPHDLIRYFFLYSYPLSPLMDISASKLEFDSSPLLVQEDCSVGDTIKLLTDSKNPNIVGMINRRGVLLDSFSIGTFLPLFQDREVDAINDGTVGTVDTVDTVDDAFSKENSTKRTKEEEQHPFEESLCRYFQRYPKYCNPCSIRYNDNLGNLLQKLIKLKRHCIWILDEWGRPNGIIYNIDLVRFICEQMKILPMISL